MTYYSIARVSHQVREILFSPFLYFISLSLAQNSPQTINSLTAFTSQLPCAQSCFTYYGGGCWSDAIGSVIGCQNPNPCYGPSNGAPDRCYCRTDLQSLAVAYLTSCVGKQCTLGQSTNDISSAVSIYDYYCTSKGYLVNVPVTTTQTTPVTTTNQVSTETATETSPQTINSLTAFTSQLPCAQSCFTYYGGGCWSDAIGSVIGCQNPDPCYGPSSGAPDRCYCRTDLQSLAVAYLTSCVGKQCTLGQSTNDISSAVSIYDYYCTSKGFVVNVPTATTGVGGNTGSSIPNTPASSSTTSSQSQPSSGSSGGLSPGAISGITIGSFVFTVLGVWLAWQQLLEMRRGREREREREAQARAYPLHNYGN